MAPITTSKQIAAPVELVFDVLSNIPEAADTVSAITQIEMLSSGDMGVGTRWKETRVIFGKESTEEMGFTEFERPHRYVVEADSCGCHYRTEFTFQSQPDSTIVTMVLTSKPQTIFAKLMSPLGFFMKGMMVKCLEQDLEDAKQACEAKVNAAATG